jgi:thiamine pyrophosphokinase
VCRRANEFSAAFIGGEAPSIKRRRALVNGAALVIAADSGLVSAEKAGITPDFIVGDMDSLSETGEIERLLRYPPQKIIRFLKDKDYSDTELALRHLLSAGANRVRLIGGGNGRLDHTLAINNLVKKEKRIESWHTKNEDVYAIDAPSVFGLDARAGTVVSVFKAGSGPWKAESKGLKWPLNELCWEETGFFSLSNSVLNDGFAIYAQKGRFMAVVNI